MDGISEPRPKRNKRCPKSLVTTSCDPRQDVADRLSNNFCESGTVRRPAIPTPDMEFGFHSMGKQSLRTAFLHQLQPHRVNAHLDLTTVLHGKDLEMYQNYRLAAVSWCAYITSLYGMEDMHTLTCSAIELLDRYVARSLETDISLVDILKDVRVTRAACLLLACNVHAVFHSVFACNMCHRQDWPATVRAEEDEDKNTGRPFTEQDVIRQQVAIALTLKGCLFPTCADNVARVLCKYILLEYMTLTIRDNMFGTDLSLHKCKDIATIERNVRRSAMELYTKRTLNVKLLKHKPVRCIAACCLLATSKTLKITSLDQMTLRSSIVHMLLDSNCNGITETEFKDMSTLLITECVVCSGGVCDWSVAGSLLKLSAAWCYRCKDKLHI